MFWPLSILKFPLLPVQACVHGEPNECWAVSLSVFSEHEDPSNRTLSRFLYPLALGFSCLKHRILRLKMERMLSNLVVWIQVLLVWSLDMIGWHLRNSTMQQSLPKIAELCHLPSA